MDFKFRFFYSSLAILFLINCGVFISCQSEVKQQEDTSSESHLYHSAANQHMHGQSSVDELIEKFDDPQRLIWQKPDEVIASLGDISGKNILDIGAGSGYFAIRLAKKGAQVVAADVEQEFLSHIEKVARSSSVDNLKTQLIPVSGPDSLSAEMDIVLLVNTYHHIEDRVDYFKGLRAQLPENSELVIVDFKKKLSENAPGPPESLKVSYEEVRVELKKAGFKDFSVDLGLLPYQYLLKARA